MIANSTRKPWTSRCRISRTTKDAWVDQEKLLVAKDKEWYQENV